MPSWEVIEQQKEAIAFACGLSCQPDVLLQVITERLISYMQSLAAASEVSHHNHVNLCCWRTLILLKDQLKEKQLGNEYVYLCSRDDNSDIQIKSKVYIYMSEGELTMTALYQEVNPFMLTRKCTGQDVNVKYTAFGSCSDLLFLLKKMRKLKWFQMLFARVSTKFLSLCESELSPSSPRTVLAGPLTLKYSVFSGDTLEVVTSLLREITKYQQVVINHLDINEFNKATAKKSFDDLFSTSVRLSKDTKILRITRSEVTSAACQRFGEDLYGCLPLRQESLNQHVALQVNEQSPFLEILDLSETLMTKSDFYALVQVQKLPHLKILNLSRINLSGCLRDILSAGSPSLEKLVLRETLLKNIDVSYLASILGQRGLPKLKELDLSYSFACKLVLTMCKSLHKCEEHLIATSQPQTIEEEDFRLQLLKIGFSSFGPNETKNLVHASHSSCLSLICLSHVNLQGQLRDIFGRDDMPGDQSNISAQMGHINHPRFRFLQVLDLSLTNLLADDLNFLSDSICQGHFVNLRYLDVTNHDCTGLESSTIDLVRSCVKHYRSHDICLAIHVDGFAAQFRDEIRSMGQGSNVYLIEKYPRKSFPDLIRAFIEFSEFRESDE